MFRIPHSRPMMDIRPTQSGTLLRPQFKAQYSLMVQGEVFAKLHQVEDVVWAHYSSQDLPHCQRLVEQFLERYHYHRPHLSPGLQPPLKKGVWALSDIYV